MYTAFSSEISFKCHLIQIYYDVITSQPTIHYSLFLKKRLLNHLSNLLFTFSSLFRSLPFLLGGKKTLYSLPPPFFILFVFVLNNGSITLFKGKKLPKNSFAKSLKKNLNVCSQPTYCFSYSWEMKWIQAKILHFRDNIFLN